MHCSVSRVSCKARLRELVRNAVGVLLCFFLWLTGVGKGFKVVQPGSVCWIAPNGVGNDFKLLKQVLLFNLLEKIFDTHRALTNEHL